MPARSKWCITGFGRLRQGVKSCGNGHSTVSNANGLDCCMLLPETSDCNAHAVTEIFFRKFSSDLPSVIQRKNIVSPLLSLLNCSPEKLITNRGFSEDLPSIMKRNFDSANLSAASSKESSPVIQVRGLLLDDEGSLAKIPKPDAEGRIPKRVGQEKSNKSAGRGYTRLRTVVCDTDAEPVSVAVSMVSALLPATKGEEGIGCSKPGTDSIYSAADAARDGRKVGTVWPSCQQVASTSAWTVSPTLLTALTGHAQSLSPSSTQKPVLAPSSSASLVGPLLAAPTHPHLSDFMPAVTSSCAFHTASEVGSSKSKPSLQPSPLEAADVPAEESTSKEVFTVTKRERIISLQRREHFSTKENVQLIRGEAVLKTLVAEDGMPAATSVIIQGYQLEEGEIRDDEKEKKEETDKMSDLDDYLEENYEKKLKSLPRRWEWTAYGKAYNSMPRNGQDHKSYRTPVEFTLMTYNILSQDLLENHDYLYSGGRARSLDWIHRRRRLIAEIACHNPDILNLQEVHRDHFSNYLKPRLHKLGYEGTYVKRSGDKSDGCVTMWKKDKFQLLRSTPVNYFRGGLLDKDNIAIVVELQPKRSDHETPALDDKIVIANTHLLFNPRRGDIKLGQFMVLIAEIDRHAYLGPARTKTSNIGPSSAPVGRYCPVILTGDFNMEPHSPLYRFVVSGQLEYEGLLTREISGQEEGTSGRNLQLDRNFFSPDYGITNYCQYYSTLLDRLDDYLHSEEGHQEVFSSPEFMERYGHTHMDSAKELQKCDSSIVAIGTTPAPPLPQKVGSDTLQLQVNTGQLWHPLNLTSAYSHFIERLGGRVSEVTTHHNRARCTVDYIFYTVDSKQTKLEGERLRVSHIRYGSLKLLGQFGLLSADELGRLGGIPSECLPSDHLCLITKFLLK